MLDYWDVPKLSLAPILLPMERACNLAPYRGAGTILPKKQLSGAKHPANPCDKKCRIQTLATDIPIPLIC